MRSSLSAIVLFIALVINANAQDVSSLQRRIEALPSPVTAAELRTLATDSPNAYVFFLQDFLSERGLFGGSADGQLKPATVKAILSYCREREILATCSSGPLKERSVEAVTAAIVADLIPVLPEGWRISDNGKLGSIGLKIELVSAGPDEAVLHFTGTAVRGGYINIELSPLVPSKPGNWVTSVEATSRQVGKNSGGLWLRTAMFADDSYMGELFEGTQLPEGETPQLISDSGAPEDEAMMLLPYIQFWLQHGDQIDTTVTLKAPSFTQG